MRCDVRKFADERKQGNEIKMSRGSVDANEGSLGSGK